VLNGGLADWYAIGNELEHVDGVMLGRVAYHDPYFLAQAGWRAFGDEARVPSRAEVIEALIPYAAAQCARGVPLRAIARHVLGLYHGRSGGRRFRQILSDSARLRDSGPELFLDALAAVEPVVSLADAI
jgi:tRNA-dihydrouridine synthase A